MKKRVIILTICLSIAIGIIAPFSLSADTIYDDVDLRGILTKYSAQYYNDFEWRYKSINSTITTSESFTNLNGYIRNSNTGADSYDESYPIYWTVSNTNHNDILSIPMNSLCAPLDTFNITTQDSTGTNIRSVVLQLYQAMSGSSNTWFTTALQLSQLRYLGYDLEKKFYDSQSQKYIFVFRKKVADDWIRFVGGTSTSGSITSIINSDNIQIKKAMLFQRIDLLPDSIVKTGTYQSIDLNYNQYISSLYYSILTDTNSHWYIYDTNLRIENIGYQELTNNNNVFGYLDYFYFDWDLSVKNPYIIFCTITEYQNNLSDEYTHGSSSNYSQTNLTVWNSSIAATPGSDYSNQLNSINNNLITIKDLISDIQVQEINNIYEEITTNYNIDIDTSINNYIGDLSSNLNNFSTNDNLTTNDKNIIGNLADTTSDVFEILSDNHLEIFYILPLACIIIGAVIL